MKGHEGEKELSTKGNEGPRRATKGLEKAQEGSAKGRARGERGKGKKISTKGHDLHERRRATKGLEKAQEDPPKIAKGRKDFHEKAKRYPRRATKNGEGPLRGWRRLKKDPPKVGQGGPRRDSKGLEKTPKGSVKGHEERHLGGKDFHELRVHSWFPSSLTISRFSGSHQRDKSRMIKEVHPAGLLRRPNLSETNLGSRDAKPVQEIETTGVGEELTTFLNHPCFTLE